MASLPEYVARLTGLSYDQAVAYASGETSPPAGSEHTAVAQALADGWQATVAASAAPTVVQDPFAALAADTSSQLAGAA